MWSGLVIRDGVRDDGTNMGDSTGASSAMNRDSNGGVRSLPAQCATGRSIQRRACWFIRMVITDPWCDATPYY